MNTSLVSTVAITESSSYKAINIKERESWSYYIKRAFISDFYHTCDYHMLDTQGDSFLFVYEEGKIFIAVPMVKREIEGSPYFDCTSVYGYTGLLSNIDFLEMPSNIWHNYQKCLDQYLKSENIVSFFCVIHPLSNQHLLLEKTENLTKVGKTIAIDLLQSLEDQRTQYRRPFRMKINQLRRKGFEIRLADSKEQLIEFSEIYRENMIKVGASSKYFFDYQYFEDFMSARDFKPELLVAYYQNEMVAGAMVALTSNIMQLHLAGTRNEFLKESPMKLIFDEACLLGRARDMHFLHLGSGVGGKEDSLFHFKRGFSERAFDFTTWKYIVDKKVYDKLIQEKLTGSTILDTNLFPLYRFI